ncbi:hypothetical protein D3C83_146740 [compost metagenome]
MPMPGGRPGMVDDGARDPHDLPAPQPQSPTQQHVLVIRKELVRKRLLVFSAPEHEADARCRKAGGGAG